MSADFQDGEIYLPNPQFNFSNLNILISFSLPAWGRPRNQEPGGQHAGADALSWVGHAVPDDASPSAGPGAWIKSAIIGIWGVLKCFCILYFYTFSLQYFSGTQLCVYPSHMCKSSSWFVVEWRMPKQPLTDAKRPLWPAQNEIQSSHSFSLEDSDHWQPTHLG